MDLGTSSFVLDSEIIQSWESLVNLKSLVRQFHHSWEACGLRTLCCILREHAMYHVLCVRQEQIQHHY